MFLKLAVADKGISGGGINAKKFPQLDERASFLHQFCTKITNFLAGGGDASLSSPPPPPGSVLANWPSRTPVVVIIAAASAATLLVLSSHLPEPSCCRFLSYFSSLAAEAVLLLLQRWCGCPWSIKPVAAFAWTTDAAQTCATLLFFRISPDLDFSTPAVEVDEMMIVSHLGLPSKSPI